MFAAFFAQIGVFCSYIAFIALSLLHFIRTMRNERAKRTPKYDAKCRPGDNSICQFVSNSASAPKRNEAADRRSQGNGISRHLLVIHAYCTVYRSISVVNCQNHTVFKYFGRTQSSILQNARTDENWKPPNNASTRITPAFRAKIRAFLPSKPRKNPSKSPKTRCNPRKTRKPLEKLAQFHPRGDLPPI